MKLSFTEDQGEQIITGLQRISDHSKKTRQGLVDFLDAYKRNSDFENLAAPGNAPHGLHENCYELLAATPDLALKIRAIAKTLLGTTASAITDEERAALRPLMTRTDMGEILPSAILDHPDIYNLVLKYGAFRDFALPVTAGNNKLVTISRVVNYVALKPDSQGVQIDENLDASGTAETAKLGSVAALLPFSGYLLEDSKLSAEAAILEAIVQGVSHGMDHCAFVADGTDDTVDGTWTGVFADSNVSVYQPAANSGKISVGSLTHLDFTNLIGTVSASALQRPCRFWISPAFLPALLSVYEYGHRLLEPPTTTGGDYTIFGFPVTWASVAPSVDGANSLVALFGRTSAYAVALRGDIEVRRSTTGPGFISNLTLLRAVARCAFTMRDPDSFALLKLAAPA